MPSANKVQGNNKKEESQTSQKSLLEKAMTPGSQLDRDEILDIVFWLRQLIALTIGLTAGVLKFTGAPVITVFSVALFFMPQVYLSKFLEVQEEVNE